MSTTPSTLKFKITKAGVAALFNSSNTGIAAEFSHVAIGDGVLSGSIRQGYQPTGDETHLAHEFARIGLGAAQKIGGNTLLFGAVFDGATSGWISEAGLFLADGTLFAVWSESPAVVQRYNDAGEPVFGSPLGQKTAGVAFVLGAVIVIDGVDLGNLTLNVGGPLVTINWSLGGDVATTIVVGAGRSATNEEARTGVVTDTAPTPNPWITPQQRVTYQPGAESGVTYDASVNRYRGVPATNAAVGVGREATNSEAQTGVVAANAPIQNPWITPQQRLAYQPLADRGVSFDGVLNKYRGVLADFASLGVSREITSAERTNKVVAANSATPNPFLGMAAWIDLVTRLGNLESAIPPQFCGRDFTGTTRWVGEASAFPAVGATVSGAYLYLTGMPTTTQRVSAPGTALGYIDKVIYPRLTGTWRVESLITIPGQFYYYIDTFSQVQSGTGDDSYLLFVRRIS